MAGHETGVVATGVQSGEELRVGKGGLRGRRRRKPETNGALVEFIIKRRYARDGEFLRTRHAYGEAKGEQKEGADFLFLSEEEGHDPGEVFERLRWGGQVVYVSLDMKKVVAAAEAFEEWGGGGAWVIEERAGTEKKYYLNVRMFGVRKRVYFMTARKVMLVAPGLSSDRFTYHVYMEKSAEHGVYEVVKEVPTLERVLGRLKEKFPEADEETLRRRARKFTEKIFPVFLTRETAILKLLHRDLPKRFRNRVPRLISAEQDSQGYVRKLRMKWLRNGRGGHGPLTQLEFAKQSAELLAALHEDAKVMHLDLRLDNFVITEQGVGFVDFGSAVRVGEAFAEASLLGNLFGEMMRTSQIQRMMGKMTENGQVTNEEIRASFNRIDKAADFFYLAVQINKPYSNPEFRGLVSYEKGSDEARELEKLTGEILRPVDADHVRFKSAKEILKGIEEVEKRLGGS